MAVIDVSGVTYAVPGGRVLFEDVSFRVGNGDHVALVGANGTGKSTLLRLVAGRERPQRGRIHVDGRIGFMHQFVGDPTSGDTVRDLLVGLSDEPLRGAARDLDAAQRAVENGGSTDAHMRYADALSRWAETGGYEAETLWDTCATLALGRPWDEVAHRRASTLSGGEQKRLALELLFRSDAQVLLLDEPDNFLDIPAKRRLEDALNASPKTILYVSHDRALLANTSTRVVTLEAHGTWTHGGSFASYHSAHASRVARIEEQRRRYREEHERLVASMKEFKRRAAMSDKFASRAKAAVTKLERFEEEHAPPELPDEQRIHMHLSGGRTGKIAFRAQALAIADVVAPFDTEIWFGERVGVVGANGTGKSHFLRLLAGEQIAHAGEWMLGARVEPGLFSQTHDRPDLTDAAVLDIMIARGLDIRTAMAGLRRYELRDVARLPFSLLSGGQQARFQLLLMELASPTMLLLDEPTDNLDVASAEALEQGLMGYQGTVIAVTHDRWFMQLMDRFLVFEEDGSVRESFDHPYA
ncbi:MAG TPA: ATP-binding cassette domain-containing protein [Actinomycetota bacterium]|nr:ATP-binding cassette domain-containing protein [Actinomycetota bacterium]